MHERSIVRALLRQVHELKEERDAQRVVAVHVTVGEFSGIEPDLFRSAYRELVVDSIIDGATLDLKVAPIEACCQSCSHEFAVEKFRFQCPRCGDVRVELIRGEALVLESVTLED